MFSYKRIFTTLLLLAAGKGVMAQTDMDAIMMGKRQLCIGPMYSYSSWDQYWEGTLKRTNENLGKVSTQAYSIMGAYGVSDKLNILFGAPYIQTKASAGTLHGMKGVQDLSLFAKWMPVEKEFKKAGTLSLYLIGAGSLPLTNYVADFLPLSIGLHSKTLSARMMLDYQLGNFFTTGSYTYTYRSNIKIDRTAYYTNEGMVYSNEVQMPNATNLNIRAGYRSDRLIAEAVLNKATTLTGRSDVTSYNKYWNYVVYPSSDNYDITRNNMPFPSNTMNLTTLGFNFKYVATANHQLSIVGGANKAIAGRNMGAGTTIYGGLFYIIEFKKGGKATTNSGNNKK